MHLIFKLVAVYGLVMNTLFRVFRSIHANFVTCAGNFDEDDGDDDQNFCLNHAKQTGYCIFAVKKTSRYVIQSEGKF